jgi:RHS repeat-associated protein
VNQPYGLNDHGHQGLAHNEAFGNMVHNRARWLHTKLGRFGQRDPMGYVDGMSGYENLQSRPLNRSDPYGLESEFGVGTSVAVTWDGGRPRFRWNIGVAARTECPEDIIIQIDGGFSLYDSGLGSAQGNAYDIYGYLTVIAGDGSRESTPIQFHGREVVSPLGDRFENSLRYGFGGIYNSNIGLMPQYNVGFRTGDIAGTWHNDGPFHPAFPLTGITDGGHTGGASITISTHGIPAVDHVTVGVDVFTTRYESSSLHNSSEIYGSIEGEIGSVTVGVEGGGFPQDAVHEVLGWINLETGTWTYPRMVGKPFGEVRIRAPIVIGDDR